MCQLTELEPLVFREPVPSTRDQRRTNPRKLHPQWKGIREKISALPFDTASLAFGLSFWWHFKDKKVTVWSWDTVSMFKSKMRQNEYKFSKSCLCLSVFNALTYIPCLYPTLSPQYFIFLLISHFKSHKKSYFLSLFWGQVLQRAKHDTRGIVKQIKWWWRLVFTALGLLLTKSTNQKKPLYRDVFWDPVR